MPQLTAISTATAKGHRPYQEDRYFTASLPQGTLFGVFDGHGGTECAHKASEMFSGIFVDEIGEPSATPADALLKTFEKVHAATRNMYEGTSASVVFVPSSADSVTVAILGDSPVIVKRADGSIWHAPEHNVRTNKAEAEAAIARGGFVGGGYLYATFSGGGLQMARAFGDKELNKVLNRVPEIFTEPLGAGSFVLVATDGVLDPSHAAAAAAAESVVQLVQSGSDAQAVVNRALEAQTGDNATALLARVEA